MSGGIEVREARPEDYRQVAAMHYRAWRQSYSGIIASGLLDLFDDPRRWADQVYPEKLNNAEWRMWLAEFGPQLVGMSIVGPQPERPAYLEIDALYVAPEHQGRRVGSLLLAHALTSAPSADAVLWCAEKNSRARRFYERKGFQLDGRTLSWRPLASVEVPQVGYTLYRV